MNAEELKEKNGDPDLIVEEMPWYQKLIVRISPRLFFRLYAHGNKADYRDVDRACELFEGKKIHIQPLNGNSRGLF